MGVTADKKGDEKKAAPEGLWASLLKEVACQVLTPDSTLLVLGRDGIGKRTLLQALLTHATPSAAAEADAMLGHSRSVALDFSYFGIRDPAASRDTTCMANCSVTILEELQYEWMLRDRFQASQLSQSAAVICLDLKEPWTMMEDLRRWMELLQRICAELMASLPLAEQDALRAKVAKVVSEYSEPPPEGEESAPKPPVPEDSAGATASTVVCNLGLPVIVVVTRSDAASLLETQKTKGWSQVIEAHIRSEALSYGAAIVYTMVQATKAQNVDVLYAYLMHRLYGYELKHRAQVPSRDALFLPAGWDSRKKVDQVASTLEGGLDVSFESVITAPPRAVQAEAEKEQAQDMQTFLEAARTELKKMGSVSATNTGAKTRLEAGSSAAAAPSGGGTTELNSATIGRKASTTSTSADPTASPTAPASAGKAAAGKLEAGSNNADLSNFFQNLLTRTQQPGAGKAPSRASTQQSLEAAAATGVASLRKSLTADLDTAAKKAPAEGDASPEPSTKDAQPKPAPADKSEPPSEPAPDAS
mmetsp:Transcript_75981/g.180738  ORF Transcript_75981/g.180738 Transcript_75981/m.180738 type:complete len:532 (+) Transcript_75981:78-1673(+)